MSSSSVANDDEGLIVSHLIFLDTRAVCGRVRVVVTAGLRCLSRDMQMKVINVKRRSVFTGEVPVGLCLNLIVIFNRSAP